MSREDATGPARFSVVCGLEDGTPRAGYATFQVRASAGGTSAGAGANNTNRTDRIQDPTQIGTELGGTAEGGIDSVWLLLPVGLLLIALIVGLWLRQATVGRSQRPSHSLFRQRPHASPGAVPCLGRGWALSCGSGGCW